MPCWQKINPVTPDQEFPLTLKAHFPFRLVFYLLNLEKVVLSGLTSILGFFKKGNNVLLGAFCTFWVYIMGVPLWAEFLHALTTFLFISNAFSVLPLS